MASQPPFSAASAFDPNRANATPSPQPSNPTDSGTSAPPSTFAAAAFTNTNANNAFANIPANNAPNNQGGPGPAPASAASQFAPAEGGNSFPSFPGSSNQAGPPTATAGNHINQSAPLNTAQPSSGPGVAHPLVQPPVGFPGPKYDPVQFAAAKVTTLGAPPPFTAANDSNHNAVNAPGAVDQSADQDTQQTGAVAIPLAQPQVTFPILPRNGPGSFASAGASTLDTSAPFTTTDNTDLHNSNGNNNQQPPMANINNASIPPSFATANNINTKPGMGSNSWSATAPPTGALSGGNGAMPNLPSSRPQSTDPANTNAPSLRYSSLPKSGPPPFTPAGMNMQNGQMPNGNMQGGQVPNGQMSNGQIPNGNSQNGPSTGNFAQQPFGSNGAKQYSGPADPSFAPAIQRDTPLRQRPPLCFVSLGFAGRVIKVSHTVDQYGKASPKVVVNNLAKMLKDTPYLNQLESFPGPLAKASSSSIDEMIDKRIGDDEEDRDLWAYCEVAKHQGGFLRNREIGDKRIDEYLDLLPDDIDDGAPAQNAPTSISPTGHVGQIEELLRKGSVMEAVEFAVQNRQWMHALALASRVSAQHFHKTLGDYAAAEMAPTAPLRSLYNLFCQRPPPFLQTGNLDNWGAHVRMLLRNSRVQESSPCVCAIGDALRRDGRVCDAQFCYLLAGVPLQPMRADSRLALLGGDAMVRGYRSMVGVRQLQLSETYEYMCTLTNSQFSILELAPFKFVYASWLVEVGLMDQAREYCEVLVNAAQNTRMSGAYNRQFLMRLRDLTERIKIHNPDQGSYTATKALGKLFGGMGSALASLIKTAPSAESRKHARSKSRHSRHDSADSRVSEKAAPNRGPRTRNLSTGSNSSDTNDDPNKSHQAHLQPPGQFHEPPFNPQFLQAQAQPVQFPQPQAQKSQYPQPPGQVPQNQQPQAPPSQYLPPAAQSSQYPPQAQPPQYVPQSQYSQYPPQQQQSQYPQQPQQSQNPQTQPQYPQQSQSQSQSQPQPDAQLFFQQTAGAQGPSEPQTYGLPSAQQLFQEHAPATQPPEQDQSHTQTSEHKSPGLPNTQALFQPQPPPQEDNQPENIAQDQKGHQGESMPKPNSNPRSDAPDSENPTQNLTTYAKHFKGITSRDSPASTFAPEPWLQYGDSDGYEGYSTGPDTPEPERSSRYRRDSGTDYKFSRKGSGHPKLKDVLSKLESLCQDTLKNKRHVPACQRTRVQRHDSRGSLASLGSLGNLISLMPRRGSKASPQVSMGPTVPTTPRASVPSLNVETASPLMSAPVRELKPLWGGALPSHSPLNPHLPPASPLHPSLPPTLPATLAQDTKSWANPEPSPLSPSPVSRQNTKPLPPQEKETTDTPSDLANTKTKTEEAPPPKKEGWFSKVWSMVPKLPARGHTGEELSMYFDKEKGKWINPNEPEEEDEAPPPPPPKSLGYTPTAESDPGQKANGGPTTPGAAPDLSTLGKPPGTPNAGLGMSPAFGAPKAASGGRKKARARYVDPFANG